MRGSPPRPSQRPHCLVVRPNEQDRDVGLNSELKGGKQNSGPSRTEAQRNPDAKLEIGQSQKHWGDKLSGQDGSVALRTQKPGNPVARNKSEPR